MSTLTVNAPAESTLLATIASGLNGGRFAYLVKDESVKAEALAMVAPARAKRRKESAAKRQALKRARVAQARAQDAARFAAWMDYTPEDAARIADVFAIFASAPKRSRVRAIAVALLAPEKFTRKYAGWTTEDVAAERRATLAGWRDVVRAYRDARQALAVTGAFPLSRFDASPTVDSRFYRNVVKHWHGYTGGKHSAIHGVTPDDVFQDAMLSAIESGDTDANGVPVFGPMYMHTRQATEAAVYAYRRGHSHGVDYTEWTWTDWQAWAAENNGSNRLAHSSMPEWAAYVAARTAHETEAAYVEALAAERDARQATLNETRQAMAAIIRSGWTVTKLANMLGRNVEAIAADMSRADDMPVTFLPAMPTHDDDDADTLTVTRTRSLGDVVRDAQVMPLGAIPEWHAPAEQFRVSDAGTRLPAPAQVVAGCTCIRQGCTRH